MTDLTADAAADSGGLRIGRVVSDAFRLVGKNFVSFALIAVLLIWLPKTGGAWLQQHFVVVSHNAIPGLPKLDFVRSPLASTITIGVSVGLFVLDVFVRCTIAYKAFTTLTGDKATLRVAVGRGLSNLWPLVVIAVCTSVMTTLGLLLLIVPGFMLTMRWLVSGVCQIVEERGVFESMRRSAELTKGHRWAVFGLYLLYCIFAVLIQVALSFAFRPGTSYFQNVLTPEWRNIATPILNAVLVPLYAAGTAALYHELRRVREGISAGAAAMASVFD